MAKIQPKPTQFLIHTGICLFLSFSLLFSPSSVTRCVVSNTHTYNRKHTCILYYFLRSFSTYSCSFLPLSLLPPPPSFPSSSLVSVAKENKVTFVSPSPLTETTAGVKHSWHFMYSHFDSLECYFNCDILQMTVPYILTLVLPVARAQSEKETI